MTELRKAAEMALRQLQKDDVYLGHRSKTRADSIEALRQALAQPVDAVNISQERVDETVKREHDLWIAAACLKSTVEAASTTTPFSDPMKPN
jgi:hypothetical protein